MVIANHVAYLTRLVKMCLIKEKLDQKGLKQSYLLIYICLMESKDAKIWLPNM